MNTYRHPNAERITREFEAWATAANSPEARNRQYIELRAKAPLRSKGHSVEDAGHLPLFVAGNEPSLF